MLAAARNAECDVLLTFNVKDFPRGAVAPLAVAHPDAFLLEHTAADPEGIIAIVDQIRKQLGAPPMDKDAYCASLARAGIPQTAELMRYLLPD